MQGSVYNENFFANINDGFYQVAVVLKSYTFELLFSYGFVYKFHKLDYTKCKIVV